MSLATSLLGSALGLGARVLQGLKRRESKREQREDDRFSKEIELEFNKRLMAEADRRAQEREALDQEFNSRLMAEYQRRMGLQEQAPTASEAAQELGTVQEPQIVQDQTAVQEQQAVQAPTPQPLPISDKTFNQLRKVWAMSRGDQNLFTNWTSQFPNPEIQKLMQDPIAWERVLELLQQEPIDPSMPPEGMESPFGSSNVQGFSYDRNTGDLMVKFHEGGTYRYSGVPQNIYQGFADGVIAARTSGENQYGRWWPGKRPSLGSSHWHLIRDNYPYQRVA